jgi:3-deoxy-D-manno-octulosonic-acid transferase
VIKEADLTLYDDSASKTVKERIPLTLSGRYGACCALANLADISFVGNSLLDRLLSISSVWRLD